MILRHSYPPSLLSRAKRSEAELRRHLRNPGGGRRMGHVSKSSATDVPSTELASKN